jgi:dsRNA-specific ribonuclease
MEHFGDSTVGWVIKLGLRLKYTYIDDRGYLISRLNEGALTDKAKKYVSNQNLACHTVRMKLMELAYFGNGEIKQDCGEQEKAQANLFEAIAYAVELDCNRHTETVMRVVLSMMGFSHWNQM